MMVNRLWRHCPGRMVRGSTPHSRHSRTMFRLSLLAFLASRASLVSTSPRSAQLSLTGSGSWTTAAARLLNCATIVWAAARVCWVWHEGDTCSREQLKTN